MPPLLWHHLLRGAGNVVCTFRDLKPTHPTDFHHCITFQQSHSSVSLLCQLSPLKPFCANANLILKEEKDRVLTKLFFAHMIKTSHTGMGHFRKQHKLERLKAKK